MRVPSRLRRATRARSVDVRFRPKTKRVLPLAPRAATAELVAVQRSSRHVWPSVPFPGDGPEVGSAVSTRLTTCSTCSAEDVRLCSADGPRAEGSTSVLFPRSAQETARRRTFSHTILVKWRVRQKAQAAGSGQAVGAKLHWNDYGDFSQISAPRRVEWRFAMLFQPRNIGSERGGDERVEN